MFRWLKEEESGQGMVEYALILALTAIAAVGVLGAAGTALKNKYIEIGNEIP